MFDKGWEFPSKRSQVWAYNPTTDPSMSIRYTQGPHDNIRMTVSYWDYKDPAEVTVKTTVWLGGHVVRQDTVHFEQGWNNWGLDGFYFDEIVFEVQGKSQDYRDLLMIDELYYTS